jgi:hypothetical protein
MECREFCEIADSYLSDELTVESNHDAISHFEKCANCRDELSARRVVRAKLREAFVGSPDNQMRPEFVNDLSRRLRAVPLVSTVDRKRVARSRRYSTFAMAACLLLAVLVTSIIVRQQLSRPQIPATIVKTELAQAAVGDHRDCAIKFRLDEKPIELEAAGQKYDPVYIGLTNAISTEAGLVPLGAQVIEAHSCVFKGRRFAHLVLKYHGSVVSLLITGIPGDHDDHSAAVKEPATILCSQMEGYNVSFFQTARHAIFVVSDLPEGENLALTRSLEPRVFKHINESERTS